jgi:hypothetical protein
MGGAGQAGGLSEGGAGGSSGTMVLERIEVAPLNTLLELELEAGAEQAFTALGRYSDGSSRDLTGQVTWSLDNELVGELEGATVRVPAFDEVDAETTRVKATLDGLNGVAQLTVVAHRMSGAGKDVLLVLPLDENGGTTTEPVVITPQQDALDLLMLMDVTGAMAGPISTLHATFAGTVVPALEEAVADPQFGIAGFADFPVAPYGEASCGAGRGDQPFFLERAVTADVASVTSAIGNLLVNGMPIGCGGDAPESMFEGLYQAATGQGLSGPGATFVAPGSTGLGGAGFRSGALPAVVTVTDARPHDPAGGILCNNVPLGYAGPVLQVAHGRDQAKAALDVLCARSLGIVVGQEECRPTFDLMDLARSTGATTVPQAWGEPGINRPAGCAADQCCTFVDGAGLPPDPDGRCPLVYWVPSSGAGLGAAVASGITNLVEHSPRDVHLAASGSASSFVETIAAKSHVLGNAAHPQPFVSGPSFHDVFPGTSLTFDVSGANDFTAQTDSPQLFFGQLGATNGCFTVFSLPLIVLVPPIALPATE